MGGPISLPHQMENEALNGVPGVTPLPQLHFEGGGDLVDCYLQLEVAYLFM